MRDEIIVSGKTVEEALASANEQFSDLGEVSFEVVELPKKGFFGIGASPAKVRVIFEGPVKMPSVLGSNVEIRSTVTAENKAEENPGAPAKEDRRAKKEHAAKAEDKAAGEAAKAEPARRNAPQTAKPKQHAEKTKTEKRAAPDAERKAPAEKDLSAEKTVSAETPVYHPIAEEEAQKSSAYQMVCQLAENMGIDSEIVMSVADSGEQLISMNGESASALIGHHGETLDAIQYLANLAENKRENGHKKDYVKITVDIGNYRAKREETLRQLAQRMAAKAVKYKRNFVLEPMNPYERRIIHAEIQGMENVSTHSVGSDSNRKIVVTYDGSDAVRRPRGKGGQRRGGQRRTEQAAEE